MQMCLRLSEHCGSFGALTLFVGALALKIQCNGSDALWLLNFSADKERSDQLCVWNVKLHSLMLYSSSLSHGHHKYIKICGYHHSCRAISTCGWYQIISFCTLTLLVGRQEGYLA